MRSFTIRNTDAMDANMSRLETPFMAGFRSGMSACGVIGRKLSALYNVPADKPDRIDALIKAIERSATRDR